MNDPENLESVETRSFRREALALTIALVAHYFHPDAPRLCAWKFGSPLERDDAGRLDADGHRHLLDHLFILERFRDSASPPNC